MDGNTSRIREFAENISLYLTIVISVVVSLLDLFGLLDGIQWLEQRIPTLTLLFVGLVATYLAFERRGRLENILSSSTRQYHQILDKLNASSENIILSLHGVELKRYQGFGDFFFNFTNRLQTAKSLEYTYWGDWGTAASRLTGEDMKNMKRSNEILQKFRERKDTIVREIRTFSVGNDFPQVLEENLMNSLQGYSVSCYVLPETNIPSNISFYIIDHDELFLFSEKSQMSIKHPDIISIFGEHFDNAWSHGYVLREGDRLKQDNLQKFKELLRQDKEQIP